VGVACLRADLEEHGWSRGRTSTQNLQLEVMSKMVRRAKAIDRGVVVEVFGILEQTG
jgi:hypothetical protein